MNPDETRSFARRLMTEVWEPFDADAVERFYNEDMKGHHTGQALTLTDVRNRLAWDPGRYADQSYDITNIVADVDQFAIRFVYTATLTATNEPFRTEVNYFYRLENDKIAEFWLLSDGAFDYKARG